MNRARSVVLAVVVALALVLQSAPVARMQETVTLAAKKVDAETAFPRVDATLTVTNRSGVPIPDLGQSSFEVLEDGQPVTIQEVNSQPDPDQPIAVCLVLDLSGSAPISQVKAAANQFLDTLTPDDRVALIGFNRPLDFNAVDATKEVEFTADKDLVRAVIEDLESVGETALYEAAYRGVLWTAEEMAERRAVVVMTDGYDTSSRAEIATADTPKAAARDKRIPVFTVGVYSPDFTSNPDYLQVLAEETGGEYYEADPNKPEEIADRFKKVGDLLRLEYQLAFASQLEPLREEEHVVTIRAITPAGEGEIQRNVTYHPPTVPLIVELQRDVNGELQTLQEGEEVRGSVLLVPRIAARNTIAQVEYYVDGAEQPTHTALTEGVEDYTHERWEWKCNTRRFTEGQHTFGVIAYDDTGTASERFQLSMQVAYPPFTVFGINIWVLVAIVSGVVFLVVLLFFLLRRQAPAPAEAGPAPQAPFGPSPTAPEGPETWASEPSTAPAGASEPPRQPTPTAVMGPGPSEPAGGRPGPPQTISLRREPEAMAWLVVQKGALEGREFRLGEETAIGRVGDNDIVLDDPAVSRRHAKIRLEGEAFILYDLGATNPTEVNGQEIGKHQLVDGDRVKIGETALIFKQVQQ